MTEISDLDPANREHREFAFDVLGQISQQVAEDTSVNAMMAALLGVLGTWLHYVHKAGVPADGLRADVMAMLDKVLPQTGPLQ